MLSVIKAMHVIMGVVFMGLSIASFFYVSLSMRQDRSVLCYALLCSFYSDVLMALIVVCQFASGYWLVMLTQWTLFTPWVKVAFIAFFVVTLIWLALVWLRYRSYCRLQQQQVGFSAVMRYGFIALNVLMQCVLVMIVRDALAKSTLIGFV